jgi:hypothetical protein
MSNCRHDFLSDLVVALTKKAAPLRMSYNDIAASKICQHRTGYFTGEGTVAFPMEILCRKTDPGGGT